MGDEVSVVLKWSVFKPERPDARFVAEIGACVEHIVHPRSGVREVYIVQESEDHYKKHKDEFDVPRAESLVPSILSDPVRVHQDKKPSCVVFSGEFDAHYFLLIPVKLLPGEMWMQTLYISEKRNFLKREWVKEGCLYVRK